MKVKIIVASIVVVAAIIFGAVSFVERMRIYRLPFRRSSRKKVQVKGGVDKAKNIDVRCREEPVYFYSEGRHGQEERSCSTGRSEHLRFANAWS